MSYKLQKPYTDIQRADFIVQHNHNSGLKIEIIDGDIYALEPDEIIAEGKVIKNPEYQKELEQSREYRFKSEFFPTSLGWIRRKVSMKDGTVKDFLSDLLLQIKAGIELGQEIPVVVYKTPDYKCDFSQDYMISLQETKIATPEFVQECLTQLVNDFYGG